MQKLWLKLLTNPDSSYSDAYSARVIHYIKQYRVDHPEDFIYIIEPHENAYFEIDIIEMWFSSMDDALKFKLQCPVAATLTDYRPEPTED